MLGTGLHSPGQLAQGLCKLGGPIVPPYSRRWTRDQESCFSIPEQTPTGGIREWMRFDHHQVPFTKHVSGGYPVVHAGLLTGLNSELDNAPPNASSLRVWG